MCSIYKKISRFINNQKIIGYIFVLPSIVVFSLFVFIPLIATILFSLFNFDMMGNNVKFIGYTNYARLFCDERFWNSLYNTVYYTAVAVPLQIIIALLVAVAINTRTFYNTILKSVFFVPAICSMTVISIIWSFLLDNDIGMIPYYFSLIGIKAITWLKDPVWAMPAIIMVSIWKSFGFNMVIILAGLQGIPDSYYEASRIDGASKAKQFFSVTLPLLMPVLGFVIITSVIGSFQVFDQVFVMTRGGPLFKTETVVQYIYHMGFEVFELGYASSIADVLFLIILIFTVAMFKSLREKEESF